ncbi:hypothetical protein QR680_018027 [Steinernema hermaphroditum]|uniref:Uncharacterized protein n=1 Tax=Steinernema hermaphroditum TaxID=289476 RepID=A0AA39HHZ0_9BILA|nr:hypothetical protein QR680_018027 [Steinernema hermaphroditum]
MLSKTILRSKELIRFPSYKIMLQLNICYFLHVVSHVATGIVMFLKVDRSSAVSKFCGGVLHLAWFGIIFLNVLLCLERLNVTLWKSTVRFGKAAFWTMSAIAWFPGVMYLIVDQTTEMTFYMNTELAKWDYDGVRFEFWLQLGMIITFIALPITFFLYVIIYFYLVKLRGKIYNGGAASRQPSIPEKSVLYSATLMFLYPCGEEAVFFVLRMLDITTFSANCGTHIMWISLPLFCQIVQLLFNRSIRRNLIKLVGKNNMMTVATMKSKSNNSNSTKRTARAVTDLKVTP